MKQFVSYTQKWLLPLLWLLLAIFASSFLGEARDTTHLLSSTGMTILLWASWTLTLFCLLLPRTTSLTLLRLSATGILLLAIWSIFALRQFTISSMLIFSLTFLFWALSLTGWIGDYFVNGSSYGLERRVALHPPASLLLGPLPCTAVVVLFSIFLGPAFLFVRDWVPGICFTLLGACCAWFGIRSLHSLSRRWLVMVPNGLVIHDGHALVDSLLLQQKDIQKCQFAEDPSGIIDLTLGAPGRALLIETKTNQPLVPFSGRKKTELSVIETKKIMIRPTRLKETLLLLRDRNYPVMNFNEN